MRKEFYKNSGEKNSTLFLSLLMKAFDYNDFLLQVNVPSIFPLFSKEKKLFPSGKKYILRQEIKI